MNSSEVAAPAKTPWTGVGRWPLLIAAVALAVGVATLAMTWRYRTAHPQPPAAMAVRLALSTTPHAALLMLAAEKDFLRDEGLDVTIVPVSHGKTALDLLARGEVDLATAAEVPFVTAVLDRQPLSILASMLSVSDEMAIVARRDRGIAVPADLLGKRIGVPRGTSAEYFLWALLIRHRLARDGVTLVDLPPGRLADELARGRIDAASTWQPVRQDAESALGAQGISFTAPAAYTVSHVVVGRTDYLHGHAEMSRRFVRALLKAERFNRLHADESLGIVARRLKVDADALRPSWKSLAFRVNLLQSQLVTMEDEADWAVAGRPAASAPTPNFLPHLYLDALLDERPDRVTVAH
ncbi:ABC transporter substrate-binding protein [Rhizobacter sp. P5_C2]